MASDRNNYATPIIDSIGNLDYEGKEVLYVPGTGFSKREELAMRIFSQGVIRTVGGVVEPPESVTLVAKHAIAAADAFFDELERPERDKEDDNKAIQQVLRHLIAKLVLEGKLTLEELEDLCSRYS